MRLCLIFYNFEGTVWEFLIEHHYGTWNKFVTACGLEPGYVAQMPADHTKDYLEACITQGKVLSFYEYEKVTGKPSTRLKRIFNTGKPYAHLKEELFAVALNKELWSEFLEKLK